MIPVNLNILADVVATTTQAAQPDSLYPIIFSTHRIVVTVFLVHYVLKVALLMLDKKEALASYTKSTRIVEMILSVLFLLTGGWMLVKMPAIPMLMVIKLVCVFASIPLAIIGFKRGNKLLALLAIVLIVAAYGLAEMSKKHGGTGPVDTSSAKGDPITIGKEVYSASCFSCHGADGKLGAMGAKDLSVTTLTIDEQKAIIKGGKNTMPGFNQLTDEQVNGLIQYIGTLRQAK